MVSTLTDGVQNVLNGNRILCGGPCEADEGQNLFLLQDGITEHIKAVLMRLQRVREQAQRPEGPVAQHFEFVVAIAVWLKPVPASSRA
jgi:hypothetical protein